VIKNPPIVLSVMNKGCLTTASIELNFQCLWLLAFGAAFRFGMGGRMVCVLAV
jgi:hypothetical protein